MDILTAITDINENRHVVAALPTGSGKSIPQLLLSSLVSPGHMQKNEQNFNKELTELKIQFDGFTCEYYTNGVN